MFRKLDALDAFQLTKCMYAAALVVSWVIGLGDETVYQVGLALAQVKFPVVLWIAWLVFYATSASLCLIWHNRLFQTVFSFISLWSWTFSGVCTLLGPTSNSAGLFQCFLAVVSAVALYYRGRLQDEGT